MVRGYAAGYRRSGRRPYSEPTYNWVFSTQYVYTAYIRIYMHAIACICGIYGHPGRKWRGARPSRVSRIGELLKSLRGGQISGPPAGLAFASSARDWTNPPPYTSACRDHGDTMAGIPLAMPAIPAIADDMSAITADMPAVMRS